MSSKAQESVSPLCSALCSGMADVSGRKASPTAEPQSFSPYERPLNDSRNGHFVDRRQSRGCRDHVTGLSQAPHCEQDSCGERREGGSGVRVFHRTVCGGKSLPEYTAHPSRSQAPEGRRAGNLTEGQERSTHETHYGRRADLLARRAGPG